MARQRDGLSEVIAIVKCPAALGVRPQDHHDLTKLFADEIRLLRGHGRSSLGAEAMRDFEQQKRRTKTREILAEIAGKTRV
jgi:hypothetical protein